MPITGDKTTAPAAAMGPPPATAGLDSKCGSASEYARADHTHATSVQKAILTTDSSGNATWTFAREFAALPAVMALPNTSGAPVAISITAKSTKAVTFNCRQARALPAALMSLAALLNFDVFANPAAGVQIDAFAGAVTQ